MSMSAPTKKNAKKNMYNLVDFFMKYPQKENKRNYI